MFDLIRLVLSNFDMAMLILAIILIALQWSRDHKISTTEIIFRWMTLALGITELYAFLLHAAFPTISAATIGWDTSPFQFEVAVANLGFGVIAILSFKASYSFRLASVLGNTFWLWGDAVQHIYQMLTQHNFSTGNAGSWFWFDVILPLILISCILKLNPRTQRGY